MPDWYEVLIRLDQYNILTKSQLGTIRSGADEVLVQNALTILTSTSGRVLVQYEQLVQYETLD